MIQKKYHMILPILTIMNRYITFIAALKCNVLYKFFTTTTNFYGQLNISEILSKFL